MAEPESARRWTERLNQTVRRLRQAEDAETWGNVLAEAAGAPAAAVFRLAGDTLQLAGVYGDAATPVVEQLRHQGIPRREGPALASALTTQDPVVALRSAGEVSDVLMRLFPGSPAAKVYLFPLVARRAAAGLLYVLPGATPPDVNALELLATLGEAAWQERISTPAASPVAAPLLTIAPAATPTPPPTATEEHQKARNFARTQVSRLLLKNHDAVRTAREMGNLYLAFQRTIDDDRRSYRERFLQAQPAMVDYLHQELVRTLAEGNGALLGSEYPGPLV